MRGAGILIYKKKRLVAKHVRGIITISVRNAVFPCRTAHTGSGSPAGSVGEREVLSVPCYAARGRNAGTKANDSKNERAQNPPVTIKPHFLLTSNAKVIYWYDKVRLHLMWEMLYEFW